LWLCSINVTTVQHKCYIAQHKCNMFILLLVLNSVLNSVRQQKIFKTHINSKHTRDLVKSTIIKYYCLESSSGDTTGMYRFFTGGLGGEWDGRPQCQGPSLTLTVAVTVPGLPNHWIYFLQKFPVRRDNMPICPGIRVYPAITLVGLGILQCVNSHYW